MKRFTGALFLIAAWLGVAEAQQQILVPTRPIGDNTNAAASTAYVFNAEVFSNPLEFGAIANTPSAAVANSVAFQNAMTQRNSVWCPPGQTFYVQNIVVPATVTRIVGGCTLIAQGTLTANVGILDINFNNAGLVIDGIIIQSNTTNFPNTPAIRFNTSSNFVVQNTVLSTAQLGISIFQSTQFSILDNTVLSFSLRGIYVAGASSLGRIIGNHVDGAQIVGASHCISVAQGQQYTIVGNTVQNCTQFGISVASVPSTPGPLTLFTVAGNVVIRTKVECINVENAQQGSITGNTCLFDGTATDLGISLFGANSTSPQELASDIVVSGNVLINPCKSGIALADWSKRNVITGNYILSPNSCNQGTADFQSGILLYGGNNSQNSVFDNHVIDVAGHMLWQIGEGTFSDGSGNPNNNWLGATTGPNGSSGGISVSGAATQQIGLTNPWITFTPVYLCGTATFTNTSSRFKTVGKTTFLELDYTITAIGTCASGNVTFTLPNTANSSGLAAAGQEIVNSGLFGGCRVVSASATATCAKNGGGNWVVNDHFLGSGSYENQ